MHHNKRINTRSPSAIETIYFTENGGAENSERMYYPATVTNESSGGIGLRVNYQHAPDDKIWLEGLATTEQPCPAIVRWVNSKDSDEYLMGVQFAV